MHKVFIFLLIMTFSNKAICSDIVLGDVDSPRTTLVDDEFVLIGPDLSKGNTFHKRDAWEDNIQKKLDEDDEECVVIGDEDLPPGFVTRIRQNIVYYSVEVSKDATTAVATYFAAPAIYSGVSATAAWLLPATAIAGPLVPVVGTAIAASCFSKVVKASLDKTQSSIFGQSGY